MRRLKEIIIHCTATPEGRDYDLQTIRGWHLQRGFTDIGYHFIVHLDGVVDIGRPIEMAGAHCLGHNTGSIGICYVGGMTKNMKADKDTRTDAQKIALLALVAKLKQKYGITEVHGHNEFSSKSCPCFNVRTDL